jgi:DNA-directed RNA polymerase alpha subunit
MEPAAKPSVLAKLKDAGIETVGQLADYTKEHDLSDIPGIGGASKEEIEAVLDPFWKQHGEAVEGQQPAEAAE